MLSAHGDLQRLLRLVLVFFSFAFHSQRSLLAPSFQTASTSRPSMLIRHPAHMRRRPSNPYLSAAKFSFYATERQPASRPALSSSPHRKSNDCSLTRSSPLGRCSARCKPRPNLHSSSAVAKLKPASAFSGGGIRCRRMAFCVTLSRCSLTATCLFKARSGSAKNRSALRRAVWKRASGAMLPVPFFSLFNFNRNSQTRPHVPRVKHHVTWRVTNHESIPRIHLEIWYQYDNRNPLMSYICVIYRKIHVRLSQSLIFKPDHYGVLYKENG